MSIRSSATLATPDPGKELRKQRSLDGQGVQIQWPPARDLRGYFPPRAQTLLTSASGRRLERRTDVALNKKNGGKVMAKKAKSGGHHKGSRAQAKGRKETENVRAKVRTFIENSPHDGGLGSGTESSKLRALMRAGPESLKKKALMGAGPESLKKKAL